MRAWSPGAGTLPLSMGDHTGSPPGGTRTRRRVRSSALVAVAFALPVLAATNASAGTAGSRHVTTAPAANRLRTQPSRVGLPPPPRELESPTEGTKRGG